MKIKVRNVVFYVLSALLLTTPLVAFGSSNYGISDDFPKAFQQIFQFIVGLATVIFVILLLVGGIQYLAAAGNEDASKKAKALILDALIGLLIVGIAFAAGNWIITKMGFSNDLRGITDTGVVPK